MATPQSIGMYTDCKELLERAMESPKGIRIKCGTHGEAINLSRRINKARALDRINNTRIYESDHQQYGRSVFDAMIITVPRDPDLRDDPVLQKSKATIVEIKPRTAENFVIDEIE